MKILITVKDQALILVKYLFKSRVFLAGIVILPFVLFFSNLIIKKHEFRETLCLALNIYHEGRGESELGKYAIATVTLNRVDSSNYPDSVCDVVYQYAYSKKLGRNIGGFSWTQDDITDTPLEDKAWENAFDIAKLAYEGEQPDRELTNALFYHADYVKPYWIKNKRPIKKIGQHIFYN